MNTRTVVSQVIERVLQSGKITPTDQAQLLHAARRLEHPLSHEELKQVRRVFEAVQMGLLQPVDESWAR